MNIPEPKWVWPALFAIIVLCAVVYYARQPSKPVGGTTTVTFERATPYYPRATLEVTTMRPFQDLWPRVMVTIRNSSPARIGTVGVRCAFLDEAGKPLDTGYGLIRNVTPGHPEYDQITFMNVEPGTKGATTCGVSSIDD